MSKNQIEIIITAGLAVIFVFAVSSSVKKVKKKMKREKPVSVTKKIDKSSPSKGKGGSLSRIDQKIIDSQKKRVLSDWGRDPFYSPEKKEVVYKENVLSLKGISIGKDKEGFAFINDQIVTVGDIIGGYKVVEIEQDKVLLKKGGEKFYLTLPEEKE